MSNESNDAAALTALLEFARLVRGYYDALRHTGFSAKEAFELSRDYQASMVAKIESPKKEV